MCICAQNNFIGTIIYVQRAELYMQYYQYSNLYQYRYKNRNRPNAYQRGI